MIFDRDCDYYGDRQDDPFAPGIGECESCYRYEICKAYFERIGEKKHAGNRKRTAPGNTAPSSNEA